MFHHVANFICCGLVPTEVMVTGMNDKDVTFFDFHTIFDHLAGVNLVITDCVRKVNNGCIMDEEVHVELGDIFTSGVKVDFSIEMRS